ncbi:hypothetical protein KKG41_05345 [Patescibacteria group bacterium]|nr:hypothetical protein [Patescibacteria group bacterium]MBU1890506.1 hypothetical protein [Patescibacteria group bacterium]
MSESEKPNSPEAILESKKAELTSAVGMMLDWQKAKKPEAELLPQLDTLTCDETDYCLELIRRLDNQTQKRGPASSEADQALAEGEAKLTEMEGVIGSARATELKGLIE